MPLGDGFGSAETGSVSWGERTVPYTVRRSARRTLGLQVSPAGEVTALVPKDLATGALSERVQRRAKWIVEQVEQVESLRPWPLAPAYLPGATHLYLGGQVRLQVREAPEAAVLLSGAQLQVDVATPWTESAIRRLVERWFAVRAREILEARLEALLPSARAQGIPPARLEIRSMRLRWGSCPGQGRLILNPALVHVPVACIDYVIAHELAHQVELHHGPEFWRLLAALMPDWQSRRDLLAGVVLPEGGLAEPDGGPRFATDFIKGPARQTLLSAVGPSRPT